MPIYMIVKAYFVKEEIMLNYAINYPMTETNAMIPNRPATP